MNFKYGIELEGRWNRQQIYDSGGAVIHGFVSDGSVGDFDERRSETQFDGEFNSLPSTSVKELMEQVQPRWPELWNHTCGMHVHVSMPNTIYNNFLEKPFARAFHDAAMRWAQMVNQPERDRFIARLRGDNRYCKAGWNPASQIGARCKTESRYYALNFCWTLHGTMEIRVFPMMRFEDATRVLTELEKFLHARSKITPAPFEIESDVDRTPAQPLKLRI